MLATIFIYGLLAYVCLGALVRPHIGAIGYYGFMLLQPQWNWRWVIARDSQFQKYIAIATLLGILFAGLRGNRITGWRAVACFCLLAFLGLAFLSLQFSISPVASNRYFDSIWKIVLMVLVTVRVLDTPGRIVACLWTCILAQGYNAFRINEQYFSDGFSLYAQRNWGYGGDNNLYTILTVPMIAISASFVFYAPKVWQRALAGIILMLQLHQVMLMESRGGMIGVALVGAVIIWYMPKTKLNITATVVAISLASIMAGPPVVREFMSSFEKGENRDASADSRLLLWKAGAEMARDYPLLGVGPYAGQFLMPRYYGGREKVGSRKGFHNLFFEIACGCGIPAALFYMSFFAIPAAIAWSALRKAKRTQLPPWAGGANIAVLSGLMGYMIASMFSSGALQESSYTLGAIGLATAAVVERQRNLAAVQRTQQPRFQHSPLPYPPPMQRPLYGPS